MHPTAFMLILYMLQYSQQQSNWKKKMFEYAATGIICDMHVFKTKYYVARLIVCG